MSTVVQEISSRAAPTSMRNQVQSEFLSFRLGTQEYGVDLLQVQEIRSYQAPTRIANAPQALCGVINLRGSIVPIIDLRVILGMPEVRIDAFTVIVVMNVGNRVVGAVVDSVSDVVQVSIQQIQALPELQHFTETRPCLSRLATLEGRSLILIDMAMVLARPDVAMSTAASLAH